MSCSDNTRCVTITWKIEGFSNYSRSIPPQKDNYFRSNIFESETNDGTKSLWRILAFHSCVNLKFALISLQDESHDDRYSMSLLTPSGEVQLTREISEYTACYHIAENQIFEDFFPQNTLTLCCRIWQENIKPEQWLLSTVLHKVNLQWDIEGLQLDSNAFERACRQHDTLRFAMLLYRNFNSSYIHKFRIEILPNPERFSTFISCNLSIDGESGRVISYECLDPKLSWVCDIEFDSRKVVDGRIRLYLESVIAADSESQKLEPPSDDLPAPLNTLVDDLLYSYENGTFSDMSLKTDGKTFPAHKYILASRSEVFKAMFEKDQMSEGRSGVVDVKDINTITMARFLKFLYSDSLEEDLQFDDASALYYAADKYAVLALKQKCIEIMKDRLAADNISQALCLADKHSDEQLLSCAVDFVLAHRDELTSSDWKEFLDRYSWYLYKCS